MKLIRTQRIEGWENGPIPILSHGWMLLGDRWGIRLLIRMYYLQIERQKIYLPTPIITFGWIKKVEAQKKRTFIGKS